MAIRVLDGADCSAYVGFRHELWPGHPAAGDWEVVREKYLHHPHAALCPGSGLYAYLQGGSVAGMMGAYPMPVTVDGALHPGHMLVDWAVLPRFRQGPVAGRLFDTLLSLPGRKYASSGTPASQSALQRRGVRIPAVEAMVVVRPLHAGVCQVLRLAGSAQPAPFPVEMLELKGRSEVMAPDDMPPAVPPAGRTAFVSRGPDFWRAYCAGRLRNGAVAVRLVAGRGEARLILRVLQVGPFRIASLLAIHVAAGTDLAGIARALRALLLRLGVVVLSATDTGGAGQGVLRRAGWLTRRRPSHWWALPRASDTFDAADVRWWLTSADRDSKWGHLGLSLALP
jgi:hypothetical protein